MAPDFTALAYLALVGMAAIVFAAGTVLGFTVFGTAFLMGAPLFLVTIVPWCFGGLCAVVFALWFLHTQGEL